MNNILDLSLEALEDQEAPATWAEVGIFVVGVGTGIAIGVAIT
ncbi:hypothetical protein [uncultured Microbulbifer sp.]|nr:hypothetical protein [uncultured Microbulbifer sp.]